jgi:hypothetical protein
VAWSLFLVRNQTTLVTTVCKDRPGELPGDGKAIIPDEPLGMPTNQALTVQIERLGPREPVEESAAVVAAYYADTSFWMALSRKRMEPVHDPDQEQPRDDRDCALGMAERPLRREHSRRCSRGLPPSPCGRPHRGGTIPARTDRLRCATLSDEVRQELAASPIACPLWLWSGATPRSRFTSGTTISRFDPTTRAFIQGTRFRSPVVAPKYRNLS